MTERKRATGFALMDAAFAADPKFLRLSREADNPTDFAASVGVFWLLLADCRRAKSHVINWEEYAEYAPQIAKLQAAHLLSDDGFVLKSFEKYAPAYRSVPERTPDTNGYGRVRSGTKGTESTLASVQFNSGLFDSSSKTYETYQRTDGSFEQAQVKPGVPFHDGSHRDCIICGYPQTRQP